MGSFITQVHGAGAPGEAFLLGRQNRHGRGNDPGFDQFLRNGQQPEKEKTFFDSFLWQVIKIGVPVALGFLIPGVGFLISTAITGAAMGLMTAVEKGLTKDKLSSEDKVEILTDFGMGFLGGGLTRIPIFNGAKTYLFAFVKSALGGGVSGGIVGGAGQAIKDKINHGEIKEEKILEGTFSGFLGGALFGGAFGVFGHHMKMRAQSKLQSPQEDKTQLITTVNKEPLPTAQNTQLPVPQKTNQTQNIKPQRTTKPKKSVDPVNSEPDEFKIYAKEISREMKDKINKLAQEIKSNPPSGKNYSDRITSLEKDLSGLDMFINQRKYLKLCSKLSDLSRVNENMPGCTIDKVPWLNEIPLLESKLPKCFSTRRGWSREGEILLFFEKRRLYYPPKDPNDFAKWTIQLNKRIRKLEKIASSEGDTSFLKELEEFKKQRNNYGLRDYLKEKKLFVLPENISEYSLWAKQTSKELNDLKKFYKSVGYDCREDIKGIQYMRPIDDALQNLSKHLSSPNFSVSDLLSNSEFRQKLSSLVKVYRMIGGNDYLEKTYRDLFLIHCSKPKFAKISLPESMQPKKLSVDELINRMVVRKKGTSDDFYQDFLYGVNQFPEKALRALRLFRYKFVTKHHTCHGIEGELSTMKPNKFDSRIHYDEAGGVAHHQRRELIASECILGSDGKYATQYKTASFLNDTDFRLLVRCNTVQTGLHEGGHGLNKVFYTLTQIRRLNKAVSLEEYLQLLRKFKPRSYDYELISSSKKFKDAYIKDISKLSIEEQERLKYFLNHDEKGNYSRGRDEVFAEGTVFLNNGGSDYVNNLTFPETLKVMLKIFRKHMSVRSHFIHHLA